MRRWYVTLIAVVYAMICSVEFVRIELSGLYPVYILPEEQIFNLGFAGSSILYFFRPRPGHIGMIVMSV